MNIFRRTSNKQFNGSLTIEACIILPFIICFFAAVMFFSKFAYISMTLDRAVNETVKQLAYLSYPISILNEGEDELLDKYGEAFLKPVDWIKSSEKLVVSDYGSLLIKLIEGDNEQDLSDIAAKMLKLSEDGITGALLNSFSSEYWNVKNSGKYMIAERILKEKLDEGSVSGIETNLLFVELPQSEAEYKSKLSSNYYDNYDLISELKLGKDDVAIIVEHKLEYNLPIYGKRVIKLVHLAVEKAWLYGSNGIVTEKEEGLDLFEDNSSYTVYITRTGIRYHLESCFHLRRSKIPVDINNAIEDGYTPCKVCKPQ